MQSNENESVRQAGAESKSAVAQAAKATKVTKLVDVTMVAEFRGGYWDRTPEERAKSAERRAREFNDFIRDHRSQDDIRLEVSRTYQDQCSLCGGEFETYSDNGVLCCASCGAEVEVSA